MGEGKHVTILDVRWGIGLLQRPTAAQFVIILGQEQEPVSVLFSKSIAYLPLPRVFGVFVAQRYFCDCAGVESIEVRRAQSRLLNDCNFWPYQ